MPDIARLDYQGLRVYTRFMIDRCYCTTLRQAALTSTALYDAALAPAEIKVTMFRLLRRIDAEDGASISALAELVGLDRSTLGRNLRVLERRGLIISDTGEDARARRVSLTQMGRAKLEIATPLWQSVQDAFERDVGPELLAVLDRLSEIESAGPQKTEVTL